uniref:Uncharacterized protein n=1 Tax=Gopherus agassizii TaxID=38772 RepID=A0A452IWA3_9SAUR
LMAIPNFPVTTVTEAKSFCSENTAQYGIWPYGLFKKLGLEKYTSLILQPKTADSLCNVDHDTYSVHLK